MVQEKEVIINTVINKQNVLAPFQQFTLKKTNSKIFQYENEIVPLSITVRHNTTIYLLLLLLFLCFIHILKY